MTTGRTDGGQTFVHLGILMDVLEYALVDRIMGSPNQLITFEIASVLTFRRDSLRGRIRSAFNYMNVVSETTRVELATWYRMCCRFSGK